MLAFAYKPVKLKLEAMGGTADLRMAKSKAVRVHSSLSRADPYSLQGSARARLGPQSMVVAARGMV